MGQPTIQTDHESEALDLLPSQFDEITSPEFRKLIAAFIGPAGLPTWSIQEIENVAFQLLEDMWLPTAVGAQLDVLGEILGLPRTSADDETYRSALRIQIAINTSQGNPDRLTQVAQDSSQSDSVHYIRMGTARAVITLINPQVAMSLADLARFVEVVPAGVSLEVQAGETAQPFILGRAVDAAGNLDTIFDEHPTGKSFGDVTIPGTGGQFVSVRVEAEE